MPRSLNYPAKDAEKATEWPIHLPKPSANTILILLVLTWFMWSSGSQAYSQFKNVQQGKAEESKVCLADYTGSGCDVLNLTGKCSKLFGCIQLKDAGIWSWLTTFFELYFKQIYQDYHMSAVALGFLLIARLIEAITSIKQSRAS